jgi:diguanylate cyclase (GGDEF)-like protein/PAS domain S-box-containing protein
LTISEAVAEGKDFQAEYRLQAREGLRWLLVRGTLIPPDGPKPRRYLGILMDVSAGHELADRLAAAEERWSFALQGAGLGVWDWNLDTGEVFWSRDWLGMLGYAEGELAPTLEVWNGLLHPEDRARVEAYGAAFLADPTGRFELEFRLRHREGRWVEILSRATLARDASGQVVEPRRLVGTHLDVTERKSLQRSLQTAGRRYEAMRESSPLGFCVLSMQGRILEVNDTYCRQSGYSRAELETLSIPDLEAIEQRKQTEARLRRIIERGSERFETRQRRKDGQLWDVDVSASYSPVEGGRFFCFLQDITARKRDQHLAELRQQLLELLPLGDQDQLLRAALDAAEALTDSQIGFLHLVLADQEEIALQVWSSRTLAEMCFAEREGLHGPVSEAGAWADCLRERRPVIHRDYASLPHRKGLPEGHVPLVREATVPWVVDGRVSAVIGVGNKACDYLDEDLDLLRRVIEMAMDFVERLRVAQQLEYVAFYDVLTGLPNRTLLIDRLNQAVSLSARSNQMLAVCHLNLDGFKPINDRLGREVGDAVLAQIGRRLQASVPQGDSVARVGGDDFALCFSGLATPEAGFEVAQRLLEVIGESVEVRGHRLHLSASIGLTLYPADRVGPDALLHHAQEAMYQAKGQRRGRYHLYNPVQDQQEREQRQRLQEFALALRTDQLQFHFQPKVDLRDGRVIGVEALVRWQHPREGLLYPDRFLPLIKGSPLEVALDEWVLATALAQRQRWQAAGVDLAVSVNISPRSLQMQDMVDFLTRSLAEYPPGTAEGLEIEILEVEEIRDLLAAGRVMAACHELGCSFSLDDFGTGFASLTYLHQLPVDKVKIDQRFVRNLLELDKDLAIVEGVLQMAQALPRPVLAEGIESLEVGFLLRQLGCQYGQGFGIARPMPAESIPAWLNRWAEERPWHALETAAATGLAPDLGVALFSLQRWLDALLDSLRGAKDRSPPPLDELQCPFCHWSHGIGEVRYGSRTKYAFIQARHLRLHALGTELLNQVEATPTRIGQLETMGQELLDLLREL